MIQILSRSKLEGQTMTEEQAKALQAENARLKALLEHSKTQLEYDELQAENAKLKKALRRGSTYKEYSR